MNDNLNIQDYKKSYKLFINIAGLGFILTLVSFVIYVSLLFGAINVFLGVLAGSLATTIVALIFAKILQKEINKREEQRKRNVQRPPQDPLENIGN